MQGQMDFFRAPTGFSYGIRVSSPVCDLYQKLSYISKVMYGLKLTFYYCRKRPMLGLHKCTTMEPDILKRLEHMKGLW